MDKAAAEQLAHAQKALREGLVIPGIAEGRQALAWHGVANDLIIMGACARMGKVHASAESEDAVQSAPCVHAWAHAIERLYRICGSSLMRHRALFLPLP